jgi:hypothetical protein
VAVTAASSFNNGERFWQSRAALSKASDFNKKGERAAYKTQTKSK